MEIVEKLKINVGNQEILSNISINRMTINQKVFTGTFVPYDLDLSITDSSKTYVVHLSFLAEPFYNFSKGTLPTIVKSIYSLLVSKYPELESSASTYVNEKMISKIKKALEA